MQGRFSAELLVQAAAGARASRLMLSTMCTGTRMVRAWSAMARVIACRIHQVA